MQLFITKPTKEAYNNSAKKITYYAKNKIHELLADKVVVDTEKLLKDAKEIENKVKELVTKVGTTQICLTNSTTTNLDNITKAKPVKVQTKKDFLPKIEKKSFTDRFLINYQEQNEDKAKTTSMNIMLRSAYNNIRKTLDGIENSNTSLKSKIETIQFCISQMKNIISALDLANDMIIENYKNTTGKKDDFIEQCKEIAQEQTESTSFEELPSSGSDFETYVKNNKIELPDMESDLEDSITVGDAIRVSFTMTCDVKTSKWSAKNVKFTGTGSITYNPDLWNASTWQGKDTTASGWLKGKSNTYNSECFILFTTKLNKDSDGTLIYDYKENFQGFLDRKNYLLLRSEEDGVVMYATHLKDFSCLLTYTVREEDRKQGHEI